MLVVVHAFAGDGLVELLEKFAIQIHGALEGDMAHVFSHDNFSLKG